MWYKLKVTFTTTSLRFNTKPTDFTQEESLKAVRGYYLETYSRDPKVVSARVV